MASQASYKKMRTLLRQLLHQITLTCFREVEYVRLWTEGQELLAQLYAAQATHEAVDQLIGSAGCHTHPEMLQHVETTHV